MAINSRVLCAEIINNLAKLEAMPRSKASVKKKKDSVPLSNEKKALEQINDAESFIKNNVYLSKNFQWTNENGTLKCRSCSASQKKKYTVAFVDIGKHINPLPHKRPQSNKEQTKDLSEAISYINANMLSISTDEVSGKGVEESKSPVHTHREKRDYNIAPAESKFKRSELEFRPLTANFVMAHNLPFSLAENLTKLLKTATQKFSKMRSEVFNLDAIILVRSLEIVLGL